MLLPLALCGGDLDSWCTALDLPASAVSNALSVANAIASEALAARRTVVLLAPEAWRGRWVDGEWRDATLWFKQHLEESLGKPGGRLKVVTTLTEAQLLARPPRSDMMALILEEGPEGGEGRREAVAAGASEAAVEVRDAVASEPTALWAPDASVTLLGEVEKNWAPFVVSGTLYMR